MNYGQMKMETHMLDSRLTTSLSKMVHHTLHDDFDDREEAEGGGTRRVRWILKASFIVL
jgi:hypothetical protein